MIKQVIPKKRNGLVSLVFPKPLSTNKKATQLKPISVRAMRNVPAVQQKHIIRLKLSLKQIQEFRKRRINHNIILLESETDLPVAANTPLPNIQKKSPLQTPSKTLNERSKEQQIMRNLILNKGVKRKVARCMCLSNETGGLIWPNSTSLLCWHCCHTFLTPPVGIPQSIEVKSGIPTYEMYGNFCSFNCAMAYLIFCSDTRFDACYGSEQIEQIHLLNSLCAQSSDIALNDVNIKPAPPKISLNVFGGNMTISNYRKSFCDGRVFNIYKPPIVPIINIVEEISER